MSKPKVPAKTQAKCTACAEPIGQGANLCSKCGTYQGKWSRRLRYAATLVGALAIVGGAVMYAIRNVPSIRKFVAWRSELRVLALDSRRGVSVFNAGDGPVWLSHLEIDIPGVRISAIPINKRLEPAQLTTSEPPRQRHSPPSLLINHASPAEWMRALAETKRNREPPCVFPAVFSDDDTSYQVYAKADNKDPHVMPQLNSSATLHFYDLKSGPGRIEIPVHGLLFVRQDCINALGLRSLDALNH